MTKIAFDSSPYRYELRGANSKGELHSDYVFDTRSRRKLQSIIFQILKKNKSATFTVLSDCSNPQVEVMTIEVKNA